MGLLLLPTPAQRASCGRNALMKVSLPYPERRIELGAVSTLWEKFQGFGEASNH